MRSEIERWNEKYESKALSQTLNPDPLLIQHQVLLTGGGRALDIASGTGDNALFLAQRGYDSYAVDGSVVGLQHCRHKARIRQLRVQCFVADLDRYSFPESVFSVVVLLRYLNRALMPVVRAAVRPGGLLFFKTFNRNFLLSKPSFPSEYVLDHGELSAWFKGWPCLDTNDSPGNPDTSTHWVGHRPDN